MAYGSIPLIGYQSLGDLACEGDRPVSSDRPGHCQREAQAMPPRHSSHPTPRAAGLSPKGGTPTPEGRAHAHRSDFRQGAYAPAGSLVLGQDAPDLLHLPGVGVRVNEPAAVLPAGSGSGSGTCQIERRVILWSYCGGESPAGEPGHTDAAPQALRCDTRRSAVLLSLLNGRQKRTPSALRAPGDISGAGAPALVRAPALPRGTRAAR